MAGEIRARWQPEVFACMEAVKAETGKQYVQSPML